VAAQELEQQEQDPLLLLLLRLLLTERTDPGWCVVLLEQ
jgi:hypothetical protein